MYRLAFISLLAFFAAPWAQTQQAFNASTVTRAPSPTVQPHNQSIVDHFMAHNAALTALQPTWPTPILEPDPRLVQYYRFSFSNEYTSARTQTVSYGNVRGGGIVAWNRLEVDFAPPAYIQHNSTALDGFGDTTLSGKFRIASGNATHGNFILTALLSHSFATSSHNGGATDCWTPTLAGGIGFLRTFDVESSLSGSMPTGKIATQGRTIAWNALVHDHISKHVFLEFENNATFYREGPHDGKMQNFVLPGVFYIYRRGEWAPTHPYLVFDAGMQVATSSFHTFNHNTISEMRILF